MRRIRRIIPENQSQQGLQIGTAFANRATLPQKLCESFATFAKGSKMGSISYPSLACVVFRAQQPQATNLHGHQDSLQSLADVA